MLGAFQFTRLETTLLRAPLGLRFVDLARNLAVTDELSVVAWALGGTGPVYQADVHAAARSPLSGAYGFRSLPGLRAYETGERPATDWCAPGGSPPGSPPTGIWPGSGLDVFDPFGASANFAVMLEDRSGRFLPELLLLCLPQERLLEVPLFSGPARPTPSGQAVLRGQVWDRLAAAPAAWALVTAQTPPPNGNPAPVYTGLADEQGRFSLFMPYASPLPPPTGSPPHGVLDIDALTWPLTIEVLYEPAIQQHVQGPDGAQPPPDLRSIIYQRPADVYDRTGVFASTLTRALRFGQELIVATQDLAPLEQGRLLVDPPA